MRRLQKVNVFLCFTFLLSCEPSPFYEHTLKLSPQGWLHDSPKQFEFEIKDTSKRYDLALQIRHKSEYEYQNLYVNLTTFFPDKDSVQQSLSIDLADAQGRWNGECSTKRCDVEIVLQQNTFFNSLGVHKLKIAQHMRVDPIPNVESLTLLLHERPVIR